jgi:dephospho-CoA kinase
MSKPFCESGSLSSAGSAVPRPFLVGVTGSIATGKSAVGEILQERHGVEVIDTDHITHELLGSECEAYNEVLARFGDELAPVKGGPIDRDLLRARAFATPEQKSALEAIMFPRIHERLEAHIVSHAAAGHKVVFVLAPLLHEANMRENFDEVWCVVARENVRLARLMARNSLTEEQASTLIGLQMSQTQKVKLSDVIIDNTFDLETTAAAVEVQFGLLSERVEKFYAAKEVPPGEGDGTTTAEPPATEGDDAKGPEGTSAPKTDDDESPADEPTEEPGDAGTPDANTRYRKFLRDGAAVGADEALAKLGDVAGTEHQEATARMSLVVDRTTDGEPDLSRELDVEVKMRVRNKPGTPPAPGACSCGCGTRCRVNCACMPDCGCACKKPVPPPKPPVDEDDGKPGKKDHSRLWLAVLGLFGLLAFLAFCLVLWSWHNQPKVTTGGSSVTVINNIPPCCEPKEPPVVVPPVVPPVTDPFNPPAEPPVVVPSGTQVLDEVPGFAFRFVHNAVRERVKKYEVTYGGAQPAIVKGFDAEGRLRVYQEYDDHHYMTFQYVMAYGADGATQVDRFEGRGNIFTGRSIYRVNDVGGVVRAEHYSALKRPVLVVSFVRIGGGTLSALNVEEFDPVTGTPLPKKVIDGKVAAGEFLQAKFYVFDWFCRL